MSIAIQAAMIGTELQHLNIAAIFMTLPLCCSLNGQPMCLQ